MGTFLLYKIRVVGIALYSQCVWLGFRVFMRSQINKPRRCDLHVPCVDLQIGVRIIKTIKSFDEKHNQTPVNTYREFDNNFFKSALENIACLAAPTSFW